MSSTYSYTVSPASLHSRPDGREGQPHYTDTSYTHHDQPTTVNPKQLLSPYSSHIQSNSASPSNNSNTPAESTSTLSVFPSDFGSDFGDPFFGVNFNDPDGGTPSFLDEQTSFNSDLPPDWQSAPTREPVLGYSDPPSPQDTTTATRSNISAPHLTPDSNTGQYISFHYV